MAASMTSKMGKTEDIVTIILECKRLDIEVVSPNVNASMGEFVANEKGQILFGLAGIRNVGLAVVEDIVAERERRGRFKDIFDFCKRVAEYQGEQKEKRAPMNKRLIESLIMAGALDEFPGNRAILMATVDRALEIASRFQEDKDRGQMSLFDMGGSAPSMDSSAEVLEEAEEWSSMEMLNKERDVVGMFLSGHPLDEFRPELQGFTTCSLDEEDLSKHVGGTVIVGGVITKLRSIETKRGDTIGAGAIQDFHGDLEMFFKKDLWEKFRDTVALDDRVLVKGTLEQQRMGDGVQVVVEEVIQLDRVRSDMVSHIHMNLYSSMLDNEFTDKLLALMERNEPFEGERGCEIVVHVETESGNIHALSLKNKKVVYSPELLQSLRKDLGALKVWVSNRAKR
jgi:DNA polymerase-3 subunit alpha